MKNMPTTIYIFNENGIIPKEYLETFCSYFEATTCMNFTVLRKEDIGIHSTIFRKFVTSEIEYIVYDHGYVMKIEGDILYSMIFLQEIDKAINSSVSIHVSPSQRVVNEENNKFIRGASLKKIAIYLYTQFCNSEYSIALQNTEEE